MIRASWLFFKLPYLLVGTFWPKSWHFFVLRRGLGIPAFLPDNGDKFRPGETEARTRPERERDPEIDPSSSHEPLGRRRPGRIRGKRHPARAQEAKGGATGSRRSPDAGGGGGRLGRARRRRRTGRRRLCRLRATSPGEAGARRGRLFVAGVVLLSGTGSGAAGVAQGRISRSRSRSRSRTRDWRRRREDLFAHGQVRKATKAPFDILISS